MHRPSEWVQGEKWNGIPPDFICSHLFLLEAMWKPRPPHHRLHPADRHITRPSAKRRRSLARRVTPSPNVHVHFQTSCPPTCASRWLITGAACKPSVNKLSTCNIWHLISSSGGGVTFLSRVINKRSMTAERSGSEVDTTRRPVCLWLMEANGGSGFTPQE